MIRRLIGALAALLMCWSIPAFAHKPSDSYLSIAVTGSDVDAEWDIALRDLDFAIGLDQDGNGELTWNEVRAHHGAIAAYALSRLKLSSDGKSCPLQVVQHQLNDHSDGTYAVLQMRAHCAAPVTTLNIDYNLFFDIDPQHKGLLNLRYKDRVSTAIFSPERAHQALQLADASRWRQFGDYVRNGVWHIWVGYDHILFLLSLLIPAVLVRDGKTWESAGKLKSAAIEVLKIVSAFTVAHSITLTLATLGVVSLPSRFVESAIAASVVVAALNNVWPLLAGRRALVAFLFGLIHGFGFASVLVDLGLPTGALALSLAGFNVGVEVGQLAIVALFLPVAYLLRGTFFYRKVVLLGGSGVITMVALVWLTERVFDLKLLA
jgi:hypothetical protein